MDNRIIIMAAEAMNVSTEVADKNYKELPEQDAYYFWNPIRGGIAVIVGNDGKKLCASSGISFERHLQAYIDGKRN